MPEDKPAQKRPVAVDQDNWTRVPTADETSASVARAREALVEIQRRQAQEKQHPAEEQRAAELARRNAEEREEAAERADEPVVEDEYA